MERVVITGLGVVTPIGNDVDSFWSALTRGEHGFGPLVHPRAADLRTGVAAQLKNFVPERHFDFATLKWLDRFAQLAVVAAREAVRAAELEFDEALARRTTAIVGTGTGGQHTEDEEYHRLLVERTTQSQPYIVPRIMASCATSRVCIEFGITGPSFAVSSACASGTHAIGQAFELIRSGSVDVAVTGGADSCLTFGTLRAWEALRVLSRERCRPFTLRRDGLVLGEGAGIVVLESLASARRRGARIFAEVAGYGASADAAGMLEPSEAGAALAIERALSSAGLDRERVGYVNAHGTGTRLNDHAETRALHRAFGAHARALAVSSTKSMHGHLLGAGGAVELVATVLAVLHGVVPPTANYDEPDPACDLNYVPNRAQERPVEVALSNSFAFGGLNAVLAVRRWKGH